jgi:hypothetical protein
MSARDQESGALYCAHVPRRPPMADVSSFTSLRRAPHSPDLSTLDDLSRAKDVGWPMERSKGGEPRCNRGSGDMSAIGYPMALASASLERF